MHDLVCASLLLSMLRAAYYSFYNHAVLDTKLDI